MQSSQITPGAVAGSTEFFHQQVKSFAYASGHKALGASGNAQLAQWYEEAYAYYQQVQTGQAPMPDGSSWQEFLTQMQWAYGQLTGTAQGGWDPVAAASGNATAAAQQAADPFGAMAGTNGNWVHNSSKARIGFIGNDYRDIWSNEIDIEVSPLSAKVEVVKTEDPSGQPAEEVLKVRVTDPATGTEAIYVIHDYEDAKIRIHVPDTQGQVLDQTGLNPSPIEVVEFNDSTDFSQGPEASIPGVEMEDREDALLYEGYQGEAVEFRVEGSGVAGDTQYHVVYGDALIRTRPTDTVDITRDGEGAMIVTVTHRDGSSDVIEVQDGYQTTVYAREQTLTIDGVAYEDLNEIPAEFADDLSVNGKEDSAAAQEYPEDTVPDRVENDVAYFNSQSTVSLHNFYEGNEGKHDITTGGAFELRAHNYEDQVRIYITPEGNYRILVNNPEFDDPIEYFIKGPPGQILLDGFLPSQVTVYRSDSNLGFGGVAIHEFDQGATGQFQESDSEALERIHLDSPDAVQGGESTEGTSESNENLERMEYFLDVAGKSWEQLLSAIRAAGYGSFADVEDLKDQVRQGHFPLNIGPNASLDYNATMIEILYNLDSDFSSAVNGAWDWDANSLSTQYHRAAERLQVLLAAMYPDHNIALGMDHADSGQWGGNNEIVIDGQSYNFTNEAKHHTDELQVSEAE